MATKAEPRLLLRNSHPNHEGFKSRSDSLTGLDRVVMQLSMLCPTTWGLYGDLTEEGAPIVGNLIT